MALHDALELRRRNVRLRCSWSDEGQAPTTGCSRAGEDERRVRQQTVTLARVDPERFVSRTAHEEWCDGRQSFVPKAPSKAADLGRIHAIRPVTSCQREGSPSAPRRHRPSGQAASLRPAAHCGVVHDPAPTDAPCRELACRDQRANPLGRQAELLRGLGDRPRIADCVFYCHCAIVVTTCEPSRPCRRHVPRAGMLPILPS